jgi:hypothetical protein
VIEIETVFGVEGELSFTVTAVGTDAVVTPMIWRTAMELSAFESAAEAIRLGPEAMLYGGVPPETLTCCTPPIPTETVGGTAERRGVTVT